MRGATRALRASTAASGAAPLTATQRRLRGRGAASATTASQAQTAESCGGLRDCSGYGRCVNGAVRVRHEGHTGEDWCGGAFLTATPRRARALWSQPGFQWVPLRRNELPARLPPARRCVNGMCTPTRARTVGVARCPGTAATRPLRGWALRARMASPPRLRRPCLSRRRWAVAGRCGRPVRVLEGFEGPDCALQRRCPGDCHGQGRHVDGLVRSYEGFTGPGLCMALGPNDCSNWGSAFLAAAFAMRDTPGRLLPG